MSTDKIEVRAYAGAWHTAVEFLIRSGEATAKPITMKRHKEGEIILPTFHLDYHKAQILMDDLWSAGLRPTEGTGSAGALAATQKHLEDMRKLVFTEQKNNADK